MRSFALGVLVLSFFYFGAAEAKSAAAPIHPTVVYPPQILWAVPNWPPFFTRDKSQPGYANEMLQMLENKMSDYHHEDIDVNTPKLFQLWKQGRKICGSNVLFNGDRAKKGYFTPLWVYPPLHVIVKEESLEAFTKGASSINVFELIKNSHFKGVLIKGRSYGPPVDGIVSKISSQDFISLIEPQGSWSDYLNMIPSGRTDYSIDYSKVVKAFNEANPKTKRLVAIPIIGYERPFIVNVACPRTAWGKAVIQEVDRQLQALSKTPEYKELLTKFFANESDVQQKDVDQFILKRQKGPWFWGPFD